MVGRRTLDPSIMVRIHVPQQDWIRLLGQHNQEEPAKDIILRICKISHWFKPLLPSKF